MKETKAFSLQNRARSIRYAWEGIHSFFGRQHNAIVHLFFTVLVFVSAILLKVPVVELVLLILSAGFVWVAEIFNTAIEEMMDHLSPGEHTSVKYIKDVSAAAVLVAAITAIITGLCIFVPKFL